MPITINDDTMSIRNLLISDSYITKKLLFKPENIKRVKNSSEELTSINREIFIYSVTMENTINPIVKGVVYQIDFFVSAKDAPIANDALEQTIALLQDNYLKNNHRFDLIESGMVLSSPNTHYCVGIRFISYETIFNKIKKI